MVANSVRAPRVVGTGDSNEVDVLHNGNVRLESCLLPDCNTDRSDKKEKKYLYPFIKNNFKIFKI